jgi:protease IV
MNYTFLKDIIGSPWQIDVQTLNGLFPILRGMVSGLHIEKSEEPQNHLSYRIPVGTVSYGSQSAGGKEDSGETASGDPENKVIHALPIRSVLTKHDQECGPRGTRTLAARLLTAEADPNVIGHVLIVESGGGQSIAVPELTEAMQTCTKPIVAWIDGLAASAAYYISCYASQIIASRETDVIGCIGTMLVWEGRKTKSGENAQGDIQVTIFADGSQEKNQEYQQAINDFNFTPAKERLLNPLNVKFQADVKARRPGVTSDQLTGRTYLAGEVVGSLIDSIGNLDYALQKVTSLAALTKGSSPSHNQSSHINIPMAKQFLHLNRVLQIEVLEGSEEGVFLNQEQLEAIDNALLANQQLVTERDAALQQRDAASSELDNLQETLASLQASSEKVFDPLNAIDPSIAAAETPEAKASAIRSLLSARPATAPVQAIGLPTDQSVDQTDWETIDNLPHNKHVDQQL